MLNKKVEEALNAQINAEFWSAYLYLSMSAYFEAEGKSGFANWFKVQFKEEQAHAEIFMNFIQSRGVSFSKPSMKFRHLGKARLMCLKRLLNMNKK